MKRHLTDSADTQEHLSREFYAPDLNTGTTREFSESTESASQACIDEIEDSIAQLLDTDELIIGDDKDFVYDGYVGAHFGEYHLQERIGSGGMARVYLALDRELYRYVAVKIIQNKKYLSSEAQAQLLKSEAISQASLDHGNVVSIYHVGTHEGLPYLVMEYVDEGSLAERIDASPIPFDEVINYSQQIVDGLSEACRIGLIHGDIKPANLLVDHKGQVKLSDFGLARHISDGQTQTNLLLGTPAFMAPELFDLEPIDEKTDLFSLGVTLFQLTFGRVPYVLVGETIEEIKTCFHHAQIQFPEEWPDEVPAWWKDVLQKLLAKKRQDRYQSIDEVKKELDNHLLEPTKAKPVPKLSSFLLENLIFGFLCLPLIGVLSGVTENLGYLWSTLIITTAIAGPLIHLTLTCCSGKTAGQLVSSTRFGENNQEGLPLRSLIKYQLLQLLPSIFFLLGIFMDSLFALPAALTFMAFGIGIAICHGVDVFIKRDNSTFLERTCCLKTVVDV